jgi:HK97 family phage portal protein
MWGSETYSGENVSVESAQKLETVFTCLRVRSEAIASLPLMVLQKTDKGRVNVSNNPVTRLLKTRINEWITPYHFERITEHNVEAWGNAYWKINRRRGQPESLTYMAPYDVTITEYQGEYFYKWKGAVLDHMEVLHFRNGTIDGICGISTIAQNRELLGLAKRQQKYISRSLGTKPNGYLTTPNHVKDKEQADKIKDSFKSQVSGDVIGDTPLLYGGVEFKPVQINPDDAQYIQTRDFTREDIYGIFRVPPTLAQNYQRATYSNAESQDLVFVKYTLLPVCVNIEEEINYKLFPESNMDSEFPMCVKFNVASLLRADFKSQTEGFRSLWNIGAIDDKQISEFFDWDTSNTTGKRFVPMNMMPIETVDEYIKSITSKSQHSQQRDGLTIDELHGQLSKYKDTFGEIK